MRSADRVTRPKSISTISRRHLRRRRHGGRGRGVDTVRRMAERAGDVIAGGHRGARLPGARPSKPSSVTMPGATTPRAAVAWGRRATHGGGRQPLSRPWLWGACVSSMPRYFPAYRGSSSSRAVYMISEGVRGDRRRRRGLTGRVNQRCCAGPGAPQNRLGPKNGCRLGLGGIRLNASILDPITLWNRVRRWPRVVLSGEARGSSEGVAECAELPLEGRRVESSEPERGMGEHGVPLPRSQRKAENLRMRLGCRPLGGLRSRRRCTNTSSIVPRPTRCSFANAAPLRPQAHQP